MDGMALMIIAREKYQPSSMQWIVALSSLALSGIVLWTLNRWWAILPFLLVILLGFHHRRQLAAIWKAAWVGLTLAVILISSVNGLRVMRANIAQQPEWDFLAFWMYGQVAGQGLNFYEPQSYQELARPFSLSEEFTDEILSTGFWYPPPTMLLFLPLGAFDVQTSYVVWYIVNGFALILDIVLLWNIFLKKSGLTGLAFVTALMLALQATLFTIELGQTNFIVLLWMLLFWRDHERPRAGIWLALGILTKPFVAVLFLYLLLRRSWRVMVSALATLAAISLLSIVVFGPSTFFSYFTLNPTSKIPGYVYTESANQSLLATVLRLTQQDIGSASPLTQPIYLVITAFLVAATGWLIYRLNRSKMDWTLALSVLLALVIYPATLKHYSVLLIAPLLLLWMHRKNLPGGVWSVTGFITLSYVCAGFNSGDFVFVALALNWFALAGISVWALTRRGQPSVP
jgi:hypothetical protein